MTRLLMWCVMFLLALGMALLMGEVEDLRHDLDRLRCGLAQYEDLSVTFETDDDKRWACLTGNR